MPASSLTLRRPMSGWERCNCRCADEVLELGACCLFSLHGDPLHDDLGIVMLPNGGQLCEKGRARKAERRWLAHHAQCIGTDVLEQLQRGRSKGPIAIEDEGGEGATFISSVSRVLGDLVGLPRSLGLVRGHVDVGGGVRVDPGDIEEDGSIVKRGLPHFTPKTTKFCLYI